MHMSNTFGRDFISFYYDFPYVTFTMSRCLLIFLSARFSLQIRSFWKHYAAKDQQDDLLSEWASENSVFQSTSWRWWITFKTLNPHHRPQYFWSGIKYILRFFFPLCWIICLNNKVWLKVCLTGFFSHFYFLPFISLLSFVCVAQSNGYIFLFRDKYLPSQPTSCAILRIHVRRETKKFIPPGNGVIIVIMKREYLHYTSSRTQWRGQHTHSCLADENGFKDLDIVPGGLQVDGRIPSLPWKENNL